MTGGTVVRIVILLAMSLGLLFRRSIIPYYIKNFVDKFVLGNFIFVVVVMNSAVN